ncbi:oxidoreductase [Salegentibacter salinarum]|uniref:Oxidoreductase n=1 Tax=Salegentibacter salinarum TaxID=447422 RepID=A0A2N0U385_9FLAO|nr:Gfo/Idh/MocA family oxidoreductase [Salegentibacter salinarum]PKD21481.1 oxidoreductase [Salegentibacter salinarum]SKB37885.1 Predicted dehydrogenase [Salegentibacter salinarum]
MKKACTLFLFSLFVSQSFSQEKIKVAVAGLTHGHVNWIFNREGKNDIEIVGIYETNKELIKKYSENYDLDKSLFYTDFEEMLDKVKPDAVSAFGATNEHINVMRACAPRKIHVMVEKPLATTVKDAKEIEKLAKQHSIQVLTNYETSWYASNQYIKDLVEEDQLGDISKVMVNSGHQGPKEIGVSEEFLEILVNPEKNGAGALMDFGCYGANLMTWLMKGEKPVSVTAVTNQNKPEIYKEVDDEATIILQYGKAQAVIQASWDWTFSRKDMEVYGENSYAIASDATTVKMRTDADKPENIVKLDSLEAPYDDPFSYLAAVVNGEIEVNDFGLYSLPLNLIVVEILEKAMESAKTGKTIHFQKNDF